MKQIMYLENGEEISFVDFFKHGIDNFAKVWGTSLWVFLKLLVPTILLVVGVIMTSVGLISEAGEIMAMCAVVITIASSIWLMVLAFKYCMVNYTLVYKGSDLTSKEIVNKSSNEAKGHIWRFLCMGMYYGVSIFVIAFLGSVLASVAIAFLQDLAMIFMIIYYVVVVCAGVYYGIMNMAACNEFYKINILGSANTEQEDNNVNTAGQSDDYFNNN